MADVQHYCSACGEIHGGNSREADEVRIAKINAERDIEVARIQRSEAKAAMDAETEQTEIVAEAEVESAVAEAIVTTTILAENDQPPEPESEPAPEPVIVEAPEPEEEVPAPAEVEHESPKHDKGYWSGYSSS